MDFISHCAGGSLASPADRTAAIRLILNCPTNVLTAEQLVALPDEALLGAARLVVNASGSGQGPLPVPDVMAEIARGSP
jgi:hypothetical protein